MVRIIDICSGKGGVGKTVVASNLGIALQKLGKKTAVIDFNFTTSHLSLHFGIFSHPITLNNVLRGEADIGDAIYNHPSGLKVVPGSLKLKDIVDIDIENLRKMLKKSFSDFDIVLLDSAPGLGKEFNLSLKASDEVLYVANPSVPSLVDIVKCNQIIDNMERPITKIGVVVNRVRNKKYEITNDEIMQFTELPILGVIPDEEKILMGTNKRTMITITDRKSKASKAFFEIAAKITGINHRKGFFGGLKGIFKKEKGV